MTILLFCLCLVASVVGAICGIGGGIMIKPTLDAFGWMSAASASFLSGCTVLSMTACSVVRERSRGGDGLDVRHILPVSLGAAAGGVLGKLLFQRVAYGYSNAVTGIVQSGILMLLILGTVLYTWREHRIRTLRMENDLVRVSVGLLLGGVSAFLGIGGGPFNLVALSYFFSARGKDAAVGSLFIILIAQAASLLLQVATGSVPAFAWPTLIVMACGGVAGGMLGRGIAERLSAPLSRRLFLGVNGLILLICVWNIAGYLRG